MEVIMNRDYELVKEVNYLLEKRCEFLLGKMNEIRNILIDYKKREVKMNKDDIEMLIRSLD